MKKILFILLLLCSLTLQAQKFDFKVKTSVIHSVDLTVLQELQRIGLQEITYNQTRLYISYLAISQLKQCHTF